MLSRRDIIAPALGCVVGGIVAILVAVTIGTLGFLSPILSTALVAVLGFVVGTVAGTQISIATLRPIADDTRLVVLSGAGVFGLLGVVFLSSLGTGATPFWVGMAGCYLVLMGWVGLLGAGQTDEASVALEDTDTLIALPEETAYPGWSFSSERGRKLSTGLAGLSIAIFLGLAWLTKSPFLLVPALGGVVFFVQITPGPTRVTEAGLVFEQRFGRFNIGNKLVEWDNFEGYRVDDDALTIVYDTIWTDLRYDSAEIDDIEETTDVLDRYLDQLSE
jgi:hypothetical protein